MEDSNVILDRLEGRDRASPCPLPDPEEVIVMDPSQQDADPSFVAYRKAIEVAEAARQRAIAAAFADHRRVLEDIEAAYHRDLAAARCRYSQRVDGQRPAAVA